MVARSLILLATVASLVSASDCVAVSQHEAFRHATVVFLGKVISIEDIAGALDKTGGEKVAPVRIDSSAPQLVTFAATRLWKGPVTSVIRVLAFRHPPEGDGYTFRTGQEYVVYALGQTGQRWEPLRKLARAPVYDVGMCVLRIRTDVARESRLLGRGSAPK